MANALKHKSIQQSFTSIYDKFAFGKYKDKTIRFVLDNDPEYILWLDENKICTFTQEITNKAEENSYCDNQEEDNPYGLSWHDWKDE